MNSELLEFTRRALEKGVTPSEVERVLTQAGWTRADIAAATGAFATIDFPIPVPRPKPYLSARDVFVYLLLFTSLYLSAYYLAALIFELIDRAFPDPLANQVFAQFSADEIRWDISPCWSHSHFFFSCSVTSSERSRKTQVSAIRGHGSGLRTSPCSSPRL